MTHTTAPRPLRVAFVAGTLGSGGAERQLYHQVRACLGTGVSPRVLSLTRGERWEEPIRRLGVPVTWVGACPARGRRALRVAGEVRRHRVHVVQSAHFYVNLYAVAAARLCGARDVGALRGDLAREVVEQGRLAGPSLRWPTWMAANSGAGIARAEALGRDAERTVLVPNAVDTEAFVPAPRPPPGPFTVLAAGRQIEVKRYDRFLRVVATMRGRLGQDVHGILVGEGPERERLEALAEGLGLIGSVTFLPATDDMVPVYQRAHALLVTSDHEGTPNVVLEAMACGLPVVAARVGGLPELVTEGETGFLVGPEDLAGAAGALERLARDRESGQRMGEAGRAFVAEHHSPARLAEALAALYRDALAPR